MPYLAVNGDGQEIICERKMVRFDPKNVIPEMKVSLKDLKSNCKKWVPIVFENEDFIFVNEIKLRAGTIEKITGRSIRWSDEQIEI